MTRSHARNNTTQANLTYYERSLLRKDGQAKRIGGDSFKPLDGCYLCLSRLTDPVACQKGHMYCRECALTNLITQKAGIEHQKAELERWAAKEERELSDARAAARERVISDFEKGMGLGVTAGRMAIGDAAGAAGRVDHAERERIARVAEDKAMKKIEAEQAEARKAKLPAFWLPSLAPEGRLEPLKNVKLETMCQAGKEHHPLSRKTLLPVILTYPTPTSKPICPSCTKELSNATPAILLSSRKPVSAVEEGGEEGPARKKKKGKKEKEPYVCGHVVCKTCAETVVKPAGRCCICEAEVDDDGRIPLGTEGTGFAAGGGVEVKKSSIAFRV